MKVYLKFAGPEGGSFGSLVGNAFINGAIGNAVAGRTGALIGVGLAATGRGFIRGGSPTMPIGNSYRAKVERINILAKRSGMTSVKFARYVLNHKDNFKKQTIVDAYTVADLNTPKDKPFDYY